ncbi:P-loop containing nucleoside triphosphate hydrolase protein [Boletus edulis BED1]|uniref:P-loop containing nucleoside triphosphate hydrolase protein n=1 Tax=Boletus edulis BED1 TaxID=1328754 RepID=A0AAD4GEH6_BOLED|nr:P-loop containing nucleoside triphosphate hydrolase protein [Boletus edulis BED1]
MVTLMRNALPFDEDKEKARIVSTAGVDAEDVCCRRSRHHRETSTVVHHAPSHLFVPPLVTTPSPSQIPLSLTMLAHQPSQTMSSSPASASISCPTQSIPTSVPLPSLPLTLTSMSLPMQTPSEIRRTLLGYVREQDPLPPHIFQLANNAYYHMRRTTQDKSLISGETGSGKSETRRCLAIKTLSELSASNPGKKSSKLATRVPTAEFVIESFGNARTLFNPNASHFGKYTELQFTDLP